APRVFLEYQHPRLQVETGSVFVPFGEAAKRCRTNDIPGECRGRNEDYPAEGVETGSAESGSSWIPIGRARRVRRRTLPSRTPGADATRLARAQSPANAQVVRL